MISNTDKTISYYNLITWSLQALAFPTNSCIVSHISGTPKPLIKKKNRKNITPCEAKLKVGKFSNGQKTIDRSAVSQVNCLFY